MPEAHWDPTAGKVKDDAAFTKFVNDHVAFKATEDARRLTLPAKPEDYKLELPKEFKAPDGIEYVPDANDPRWPMLREYAHKNGWSQDDVSRVLELDAAGQVGTQQMIANAKAAEVQKLGANGTAIMTAVNTFVAAVPGVTETEAKAFERFMYSADQVRVMTKIMAHVRTQGAGGFDQRHREVNEPGKLPQAEYDSLSMAERDAYARKFPQPQLNGR